MKRLDSLNYRMAIAGCLLSVTLLFTALSFTKEKYTKEKVVKKTISNIQHSVSQGFNKAENVFDFLNRKNKVSWNTINRYFSDSQYGIIVLEKDSIIYWNNNRFPVNEFKQISAGKVKIIITEENKLFALKAEKGKYTVIIFHPLDKTILPEGVKITKEKNKKGFNRFPVRKYTITIETEKNLYPHNVLSLLFLLYVLGFFFATESLFRYSQTGHTQSLKHLIGFTLAMFAIRVVQFYLGYPEILHHSFWTTVRITPIKFLSHPADLVMDAILIIAVTRLFTSYSQNNKRRWKNKLFLRTSFYTIFLLSLPLGLYILSENIFQGIGVTLYPENIYFSTRGILKLTLLLAINLSIYLWIYTFIDFFIRKKAKFIHLVIALTIISIVVLSTGMMENTIILLTLITILGGVSIIWYIPRKEKPFFHIILTLFLFSMAACYFINHNETESLNAHQRFTANILTQKKDPYLEYLLTVKAKEITKDIRLRTMIESNYKNKEERMADYLNSHYFRGFLKTYSQQVTLCEPGQQLEIQPDNRIVGCNTYFRMLNGKIIDSTKNFELSLISSNSESIYYLAHFKFNRLKNKTQPVNLYIEFFTNRIPKGLGYPELLQSSAKRNLHLEGYSFAYYTQGKLEYKFGDFLFPIDFSDFKSAPLKTFFDKEGYTHYILNISKTEKLIVSRPGKTLSNWLLPFSLLYILSGLLVLFFVLFKYGRQIKKTFQNSFSTRLQISIFTAMVLVYGILTVIIIYYFNINSRQAINNNLKEKTHSVIIELQQKLIPFQNNLYNNKQEIQSYLQKFSMVFFTDINLYNKTGKLVVSSRPEIFNRGLLSSLMNPKAYMAIEQRHKLFYLGEEKIKGVHFYSAYAPFFQTNGKETGVINLPYFARQSELQRNYFQMLANLINLFVIIGLAGMLFMMYLSRVLTKPLILLQQKIGEVSIEKQNEKIEWNSEDEIGQLIAAYNKMVDKLEESARLLKDSAQEQAWRDMARQIAHEIRNPLTPMKLNVQYLQRLYKTEGENFEEKLKSVSQALIDQIETMNEVVNMFSDFAKTKKTLKETGNLSKALTSAISLFQKSYPVEINLKTEAEPKEIKVKVATKDLLRIFNNMLKNAVQSMENNKEKKITIHLKREENYAVVAITDSGKGISKTNKKHIFQPYFTTKTKGTGLGLAIVKNMMQQTGGKISFVSEEGRGTTFILKFPLEEKD